MKILIIRLSSLGDVVMTTPLVRCIRKDTNAQLHYLTKIEYAPILSLNPNIEKLYYWNSAESTMPTLQKEQFDIVIDFHNTIRSRKIARTLNAKLLTTDKMPIRKWLMLSTGINLLNNSQIIDRHFECVKRIGVKNDGLGMDIFTPSLPLDYRVNDKIIINAGGSTITKRIPIKIINELNEKTKYKFEIIGGNDVVSLSDKLKLNNVSTETIGQKQLIDNIIAVKNCRLVITGDTGFMHIAAAFNKPMIVIWGSTSSEFGFYPYYEKQKDQSIHVQNDLKCRPCSKYGKYQCPKGHMDCLNKISTKEIIAHIDRIMIAN